MAKEGLYLIEFNTEITVGHFTKYGWYLIGTDEEIPSEKIKIIKMIPTETTQNIWEGFKFSEDMDFNKSALDYLWEQEDYLSLLSDSLLEMEIFPANDKKNIIYQINIMRPSIDIDNKTKILSVIQKGKTHFPVDIVSNNPELEVSPIKNVIEENFLNSIKIFLNKPIVKTYIEDLYQELLNNKKQNN